MTVKDFKRISFAELDLSNTVTIVGGNNAQGKSSAIDAFVSTVLGAKQLPAFPVRKGEDKAEVTLRIETPTGPLNIKRITYPDKKSTVEVTNDDGMKRTGSVQEYLSELFSIQGVDPTAFILKAPADRVKTLACLLNIDFTEDNKRREELEGERKRAKLDRDSAYAEYDAFPAIPKDTPDEEISIAGLSQELQKANTHNEGLYRLNAAQTDAENELNLLNGWIKTQTETVESLRAQLAEAEDRLAKGSAKRPEKLAAIESAKQAVRDFKTIDTSAIQLQIASAEMVNKAVRTKKDTARCEKKRQHAQSEFDRIDGMIKAIDSDKAKKLKEAKWPVPGMSMDEREVYLNGIPFDQASSAEQLRASVPLAFYGAGRLVFAIIRHGSLLDKNSLDIVAEEAEKSGAQLIIERVSEGEECTVVFEEGTVKA